MATTINRTTFRWQAHFIVAVGFALSLTTAHGQASVEAAASPPASPSHSSVAQPGATGVPPPEYVSVFKGYKAYNDQPIVSWRESNEVVEKIGGWRAYAKEASQGDSATTATDSPASHADHGKKP